MDLNRKSSLHYAVAALALFGQMIMTSAEERTKQRSHYTDAHHSLHRLVRQATHSNLKDFEIAIPEITHAADSHRRSRRSSSHSALATIVKLFAHGHDFHVELITNDRLLAKSFAVKRIRRDVSTGDLMESEENSGGLDCHYTGRMLSHGNKTTAISICDGLSGLLRAEEEDFILEPVPPHLKHDFPAPQQPHLIYKRKYLQDGKNLHFCGKQKRHPMAVLANGVGGIRHLSDGAIVIKTPEEIANEYDRRTESHSRRKRSPRPPQAASAERRLVVETVVVADQQLIKNHENDRVDVTTYILTVMNMVNALFHDGTLDSEIDITLVGITLLEDDSELKLDHRAGKALANFCQWQANATTTTERKPDHAILLTGIDICIDKNEPCDTLGLAQIGGMCSRSDSCTVNEDMGLGLAFTVAHETGHSFGMKHDGIANSCNKRGGHIMSPTVNTLNGVFTWSSCSRRTLKTFLKSGHSRCLDDAPHAPEGSDLRSPEELPGQTYTASDQCKLLLGADARLCHFRYENNMEAICKHLWCQRGNGVCETKYMPAAEGTICDEGKWCRRGVCVLHGSPGPDAIDGAWSKYGPWSDCTRTCGGGISFRLRLCNNPMPQYGGRFCEGEERIYESCNTQDCPADSKDFRSEQCAEFDAKPYRSQQFTWVPYTKYWKYDFNKCELLCEADGHSFFDLLAPHVKDGTSCDDVTRDVCIEGECTHVGCDRVLYSNATLDACGVCKGDNSTCRFVKGSYVDDVKERAGYFHVARIPKGARTISVWEDKCCTHAFIAVRSASSLTKYYLNGNWRVNLYGNMKFAGVSWKYEREIGKSEVLTSDGPVDEDIVVEALILRGNPGVSFSYAVEEIDNRLPYHVIEEKEAAPRHTYQWKQKLSECSKSCAGGQQDIVVTCLEDEKNEVGDSFCDNSPKPSAQSKSCNINACPTRWEADRWSECSRTCGRGSQTRKVFCKRLTPNGDEGIHSSRCNASTKPALRRICKQDKCPDWVTGNWTRCSNRCGRGVRTRPLSCKSGPKKVSDGKCDNKTKPIFRKSCFVSRCRRRYRWLITPWGQCTTTCGKGYQRRALKCSFKGRSGRYKNVRARKCRRSRKPNLSFKRPCLNGPCGKVEVKTVAKMTTTTTAKITTEPTTASTTAELDTEVTTRTRKIDGTTLGVRKSETKASRRTFHPSHRARWIVSSWQQCTAPCGGGRQVRTVKCMLRGKPSTSCSYATKPSHTRDCNTNECVTNIPEKVATECEDQFKWCYLVPHHNTCTHRYFGQNCCKSCQDAAKAQLIAG